MSLLPQNNLNRRSASLWVMVLILLFSACNSEKPKEDQANAQGNLPNIVIIYIDDEGYGDVGSYGATGFRTPNLDRMASEGIRFTNFYSASSICSPARAGLLTGCYPQRVGMPRVLFPAAKIGLNKNEFTLAELVKEKGYKTSIIGKWHLGHHKEFLPLQHGFDEFFGLPYSNDMWPVDFDGALLTKASKAPKWKINCQQLPLIEGNDKIEEITTLEQQNELTTRYTGKAVDFINRNAENPFFLYVPHSMAHVPLGVSDKFRGKSEQGLYGDVMMEIDWSVGEIMSALEANGISENTLLIFTTDNGPWLTYGNHGGSNGGLREGKISNFEGGFRVPCLMKWPNVIAAGMVSNQLVAAIDIYPTIANALALDLPETPLDGRNMLSILQGNLDKPVRDEFYYYDLENLRAVRYQNWKYVFPHQYQTVEGISLRNDGYPSKPRVVDFEGGLYNLRQDPGERNDLKQQYPAIVQILEQKADSVRNLLGDKYRGVAGTAIRPPGRIQ